LSDVSLQDSNPTNIESRQNVENAVAFERGLQVSQSINPQATKGMDTLRFSA